jgi:hypothetical protein
VEARERPSLRLRGDHLHRVPGVAGPVESPDCGRSRRIRCAVPAAEQAVTHRLECGLSARHVTEHDDGGRGVVRGADRHRAPVGSCAERAAEALVGWWERRRSDADARPGQRVEVGEHIPFGLPVGELVDRCEVIDTEQYILRQRRHDDGRGRCLDRIVVVAAAEGEDERAHSDH